ncbi:hypothetical protein M094_0231 [Bacteroides uniformis str. 3978 T3 ii]|uniref:Uncharacterized protein n=1 Tax=Bacteroides uniformis str. 3978 T3 ii TaxID=1339349 RepID=A0A078S1Q6_BACUN|nr:hypothetical protein M094_0231 [Bacteroides uniformis str. 3978 T3 ii]
MIEGFHGLEAFFLLPMKGSLAINNQIWCGEIKNPHSGSKLWGQNVQ